MVSEIGKAKFEYPHADFNQELFDKIVAATMDDAKAAMDTDDKNVRETRWNALIEKWHELFLEEYPTMDQYLDEITYKFQKKIVKAWLLEGHRVDGRQKNEIRPLGAEVDVYKRQVPLSLPSPRRKSHSQPASTGRPGNEGQSSTLTRVVFQQEAPR